jgi:hypothetical protein
MKRTLLIAGLALSAMSFAEENPFQFPTGVSLRAGWVYTIDTVTRRNSDTMIGVGLDYYLKRSFIPGGESTVSIDWLGKSASGAKTNIFPILLTQRVYQGDERVLGGGRSYTWYGAGVAFIDVTNSGTAWCIGGGFGYEFSGNLFGEVRFLYSDAVGGARATSLGGYIGYRF